MPLRTAVYYAQVLDFQAFLRLRARKTEVAEHAAYLKNFVLRTVIKRLARSTSLKVSESASFSRIPVPYRSSSNVRKPNARKDALGVSSISVAASKRLSSSVVYM